MSRAGGEDAHVEDMEDYEDIIDEDVKSVGCGCDSGGGDGQSTVAGVDGGHSCPEVPRTACALLYPEEGCGGRRVEVAQGGSDR